MPCSFMTCASGLVLARPERTGEFVLGGAEIAQSCHEGGGGLVAGVLRDQPSEEGVLENGLPQSARQLAFCAYRDTLGVDTRVHLLESVFDDRQVKSALS